MELIAIFGLIGAGIALVVAARHVGALLSDGGSLDVGLREDQEAIRLGDLAERKAMLVSHIRSTELDYETGKITEEDRDRTVRRLEREAVGVLKAMDDLRGDEIDRDAADREVDALLARVRSEAVDADWSPAARRRHGGVVPQAGGAS